MIYCNLCLCAFIRGLPYPLSYFLFSLSYFCLDCQIKINTPVINIFSSATGTNTFHPRFIS